MRYLCVHCEQEFQQDDDGDKPRCPKCMRVGSVRELGPGEQKSAPTGKIAIGALVLLALAAGGYALFTRDALPDAATLEREGLSQRVIEAELERRKLDVGRLSQLLIATDEVEAFAKQHAGAGAPEARAEALAAALRARGDANAFTRRGHAEPRPGELLLPDAVLKSIAKDGARASIYSLELAALAVAGLRAVGVEAMVAEVASMPERDAPLDPSGQLGYYAVALPAVGDGAARVFDVYSAQPLKPPADRVEVLTDLEAIGAAVASHALGLLAANGEPGDALKAMDTALALRSGSATLRAARATVLATGGGGEDALAELRAAVQMSSDGAHRHNLATLLLLTGDVEGASKQLALALEQYPDFAAARATLAGLHMASREMEQARAELEKAERLDPELTNVLTGWAQYHAARGELPQALARSQRAVELAPDSPRPLLLHASMLRSAGRYDDMRRAAREVLSLVPASQKERTKAMIGQLLGPTALEQPEDEAAAAAGAAGDAGIGLDEPGRLDLSAGSKLLGGGDDEGPSLLGGDSPLNLGGDTPKLRLGGSGGGLKLDP